LIPEHIALDNVDFWFQDEARIGQQNTATRLWAVCPGTGETEALIAHYVDKNNMTHHLEQISAKSK
jgi:hypothetical protein